MGTVGKVVLATIVGVAALTALKMSFGGNRLADGSRIPDQPTLADFTRAREAELESDAREAIQASLRSPQAAEFRNVRIVDRHNGFMAVCGEVSAGSLAGGFTQFIVSYADNVGHYDRKGVSLANANVPGGFPATWRRDCG